MSAQQAAAREETGVQERETRQWMVQCMRISYDTCSPVYCPAHNSVYLDFVRDYERRHNPRARNKDIRPVSLLNSGTYPALNGVARYHHGEGNQARLGSMTEDTGGTSMSEERSNAALTLVCVICQCEIDLNDRSRGMRSVRAPCNHMFHWNCLFSWTERKVRF